MSRKNSSKELKGVYRRCLSALNQTNHKRPAEVGLTERMVEQASKEASFAISKERLEEGDRKEWTEARVRELLSLKKARHCADPNAAAKERIKVLMANLA